MSERDSAVTLSVVSLLRTLQIASPSLPVGAYAYSQGLENAVELGWVHDEPSAQTWILGLLDHAVAGLDIPIFARSHRAWNRGDLAAARDLARFVLAARESAELRAEEQHLGRALARVLAALGIAEAEPYAASDDASYVTLFALAAVTFDIELRAAAAAYGFAWAEHQVSAATRLVPLGQLSSQRILSAGLAAVAAAVERGLGVDDDGIGFVAAGQAMVSAWHEQQHTRLFRS